VIFLARTGKSKAEIKDYVCAQFGYDLSRTCDEIRPGYHHVETCQETVPEVITAFLEGTDFEDLPADWVCPLCGASKDDFEQVAADESNTENGEL